MPTLSNKEIEERLSAAGNSLLQPPSSVDELLSLLDRTEELLSKVEQSPPKSMQNALSPLMKALVMEELLKHADVDVKVGVASCISEITRITAPDAPYDDDKMKDVFQLIVSSFENLSDTASRSYVKRATILETVAKVRSCVIMLDLECDQMIIEMFQHFLNAIRDYHADIIFTSMETIMSLVLEESEDIAPNLLNPILDNLKMNNEAVPPIAKKLAERVFQSSADKIKPYLTQAIKASGTSVNDYCEVVASVCRESVCADVHSTESISKDQSVVERKSISASPVPASATQVANNGNNDPEETNPEDKSATVNRSPKSSASNGVNESGIAETLTDANYSKKEADSNDQFAAKSTTKTESDDSGVQKPPRQEDQVEHAPDGIDSNSTKDFSKLSDLDGEKQPEPGQGNQETPEEDVHSSPGDISPTEAAKTLDKVEETSIQLSPSKADETVASPTVSGSLPDESREKKSGRAKRKEISLREETVVVDAASKSESEEHVSEAKKQRRVGRKQSEDSADKDITSTEEGKNDNGATSDSEARSRDEMVQVEDTGKKMQNVTLSRKGDRKKSGKVKSKVEKDVLKSSAREDQGREMENSPRSPLKSTKTEDDKEETPRMSNKRKRTPGTEKTFKSIEYGENLVGSKVKVWWPKDRMFYEGVIASFDSAKKRHKVLYTDGDKEVLNLKRERWEFIGDDSVSDKGQAVEDSSHDISSDAQRKRKGASSSEFSSKLGKEGSPRSKLKDSTKSGGKSKAESKMETKCKDNLKSSGKSEDPAKTKDRSQKVGGKSPDLSAKGSGRSKDVDVSKTPSHSKQDSQRIGKSKGKSPQSSKTLGANGTGAAKSSSSRSKESNRMKERASDSAKTLETAKGKSSDIAKSRVSESKSGKKRRR